ncbi:MAG: thioredoxin family protein [Muribaculaceae bacterium]|nr:thioredoxin family protein [Muribaculaceae bacterium]
MDYKEIINSSKVVLVEFFASWCPHCQRMMPVVAQIKELLQGQVNIYQFDIDEYTDLAQANGADSVPTFIIYKDGVEQWRESGEIEGQVLLSKIESYLR